MDLLLQHVNFVFTLFYRRNAFDFQMFYYGDVFYQYPNKVHTFNLGMISSTAIFEGCQYTLEFDVSIDIYPHLSQANMMYASYANLTIYHNTMGRKPYDKVVVTYFNVSQSSLCWLSITTELGRITMNFRYGTLQSWNNHSSVKDIESSSDIHVFVTYNVSVSNVTFLCLDPGNVCGGIYISYWIVY